MTPLLAFPMKGEGEEKKKGGGGEVLEWNEKTRLIIVRRKDRVEEWVHRAEHRVAGGGFCQFEEYADDRKFVI